MDKRQVDGSRAAASRRTVRRLARWNPVISLTRDTYRHTTGMSWITMYVVILFVFISFDIIEYAVDDVTFSTDTAIYIGIARFLPWF